MANVYAQNTCSIDTGGVDSGIGTGKGRIMLYAVIFTPNISNDQMELRNSAGGAIKFFIRGSNAKNSMFLDLSHKPIVFNGAIHIETLTNNAKAILIVEVTQ